MTTQLTVPMFKGGRPLSLPARRIAMKFVLTVSCVLLASCTTVPVGRYQALRAAGQDVLEKTSETYARIEKRQRGFAVLTAPNQPLTANSFRPTVQGASYDIAPELRYRENALGVLVSYASVLEALASKDFESGVDRSAQELASRLRALDSGPNAKEISNVFAAVVDSVGREVTNRMRKRALATAMDMAQPAVDKLCLLIQGSNDKITVFVGLMRDRYVAHANADRPAYGTAARYRFDLEIADVLEETGQIIEALKSTSTAVGQLPQAHREIRESLDHKERPLTALREMLAETRRLQGFYKSLPNK